MIEHVPVLLQEVLAALDVREDGTYVDGTFGFGGHAGHILDLLGPRGRLVGIDRDGETLLEAAEVFRNDDRVALEHAHFGSLDATVRRLGMQGVDGVLLDLGVSMYQLTDPERGFSFRSPAPLDMRMDRSRGSTAAELVNMADEKDLADMIYHFGEERASRRIARAIVRRRPFRTCEELAEVIERAMPRRGKRIHPATRTFQALRIAVNEELDLLPGALASAAAILNPGGRFCVIAYHSLEDRIVKETFRELGRGEYEILTKKPLRASRDEVLRNRAARSARLRAIRRERPEKNGEKGSS